MHGEPTSMSARSSDTAIVGDASDSTTTREQFRALAAEHRVVPVTRKVLADSETPLSAYEKLAGNRPGTFLLESARERSFVGRGGRSSASEVRLH